MRGWSVKGGLLSVIFCLSAIATIAAALLFSLNSGFFADNGFRCGELLSSGANDEVAMMLFVILLAPVIWRASQWHRRATAIEIGGFLALYGLALVWALTSLECGDFFFTAFVAADTYLQAFCFFSVLAVGTLVLQRCARP